MPSIDQSEQVGDRNLSLETKVCAGVSRTGTRKRETELRERVSERARERTDVRMDPCRSPTSAELNHSHPPGPLPPTH